ncbi:nucleoside diphosphate kinase 7 isoform X2 [Pseudomyrmex gracilis]|uniref:nucleoside diphosphate kinase 7 isoform X2 n=1 Tax=Pseudomyrmex gracilis TaxID=219809 RepID=UPI000994BAAF|nr:nucleoside diphosphate kinase 7 isoform X2 [Pseudomyrmex gracilis]
MYQYYKNSLREIDRYKKIFLANIFSKIREKKASEKFSQKKKKNFEMSADHYNRYAFEAEWYDKNACITRKFYLYYYPSDNTIELFDLRTRQTFLRRTICEGIQLRDFHVNAVVTLFSRNMKILGYADEYTKNKFETEVQNIFVLLKPHVVDEKLGHNCVQRWMEVVGPENSELARILGPFSLRGFFGIDEIRNAVYGSENLETAKKELQYFFSDERILNTGPKTTAVLRNCTCCIIKPHAVREKLTGAIINDIQKAGYTITALQQYCIGPNVANEFLEVYKEVLPKEVPDMVEELHSGPCIVMEITQKIYNSNIVNDFRNLCGPADPDMARKTKPHSLRARYGKTKIQNAVHCSELAEDGVLEVQYFFTLRLV